MREKTWKGRGEGKTTKWSEKT